MITVIKFTFNEFQENTYVLHDQTNECIIIDPGCYTQSEQKELQEFIEQKELKPVKLINTHCHIDHILGNRFVADTYSLKLELHELEAPMLKATKEYAPMYNIQVDSPEPEVFLKEGSQLTFGESTLEIIFTPGHSPGEISFYAPGQKFIIAGDVLFLQSIGRTDLPGGDMDTLLATIKEKIFVLPDDVIVYSGHGPETNVGFEKKNNPFLKEYA